MLKNFKNEQKTKSKTKKRPYNQHRELVSLLFRYPKIHFCRTIILNDCKVKKNQFTLLLGNNICKGLKILKLGFELKFISHRHRIPTITYRCFNYDTEIV